MLKKTPLEKIFLFALVSLPRNQLMPITGECWLQGLGRPCAYGA